MGQKTYRISGWLYKPASACLIGTDETRRLTPQLNRLLLELIKADEQTLSKDELIKRVWAGRLVSDDAIARAVSELRKVLRTPEQPEFIETLHGFGYHLSKPAVPMVSRRIFLPFALVALAFVVASALTVVFLMRPQQAELVIENVTPMTAFGPLEPGRRYFPIVGQLTYLVDGVDGASLFVADEQGRRAILEGLTSAEVAIDHEGRKVAWVELGSGCEVRLMSSPQSAPETLVSCIASASWALTWTTQGTLLFAQLGQDEIQIYTFQTVSPAIQVLPNPGCRRLTHIDRGPDGRTYLGCETARGDGLFEVVNGELVEMLRYRSIEKFALDRNGNFFLLHQPRWKAGITRFRPPDQFTFLPTGWALDLIFDGKQLVLVRNFTNADLVGVSLDSLEVIEVERSQVGTQAFSIDAAGHLWQIDDRAGQLSVFRSDQHLVQFDSASLPFEFSDVQCLAIDLDDQAIIFTALGQGGAIRHHRHDIKTGALLQTDESSEPGFCPDDALPAEVTAALEALVGEIRGDQVRSVRVDTVNQRVYAIVERTAYIDIAVLEVEPNH